jgi:hypothetical protein
LATPAELKSRSFANELFWQPAVKAPVVFKGVFGRLATPAQGPPPKAKGVKIGREPKLTEHQKREAIRRRDRGDETLVEKPQPACRKLADS